MCPSCSPTPGSSSSPDLHTEGLGGRVELLEPWIGSQIMFPQRTNGVCWPLPTTWAPSGASFLCREGDSQGRVAMRSLRHLLCSQWWQLCQQTRWQAHSVPETLHIPSICLSGPSQESWLFVLYLRISLYPFFLHYRTGTELFLLSWLQFTSFDVVFTHQMLPWGGAPVMWSTKHVACTVTGLLVQ